MSDSNFLNAIYKVAEKAKRSPLTAIEKQLITEEFNKTTGSAYDRSIESIKKVIGRDPKLILEKAATLDDINRLLADLKMEAQNWQQSK